MPHTPLPCSYYLPGPCLSALPFFFKPHSSPGRQIKVRCSFSPSPVSCVKPTGMAEASLFSFSQDGITHQVARAFTQTPSSSGTVHSAMAGISKPPDQMSQPTAGTGRMALHTLSASEAGAHLAQASGRPCSTPSASVPWAPGHIVSCPQHPAG